jgi:hypothetical protein
VSIIPTVTKKSTLMRGPPGGFERRRAPRPWQGPAVAPSVEPRRGRAGAEGRQADRALHEASAWLGWAAGSVHAAAIQGFRGGGQERLRAAGGGKAPGRRAGRCPGGASAGTGVWRAGDVAVRNWEQESCVPSQSPARDGGEGDTGRPGRGHAEPATPVRHTEEGWEPGGGWRSQAGAALPVTRQNGQGEAADAAGAEAHRVGRESSAVCARPPGVRELGCGEEGW